MKKGCYLLFIALLMVSFFLVLVSSCTPKPDENEIDYAKLKPTNLSLDEDECKLSWESVSGAEDYSIFINNSWVANVTEASYSYEVKDENLSFLVRANFLDEKGEKQFSSFSDSVIAYYVEKLNLGEVSQKIANEKASFSWDDVEGIESYFYTISLNNESTGNEERALLSGSTENNALSYSYSDDGLYTLSIYGRYRNRITDTVKYSYRYNKNATSGLIYSHGSLDLKTGVEYTIPFNWGNSSPVSVIINGSESFAIGQTVNGLTLFAEAIGRLGYGEHNVKVVTTIGKYDYALTVDDHLEPVLFGRVLYYSPDEKQDLMIFADKYNFTFTKATIGGTQVTAKYDENTSSIIISKKAFENMTSGLYEGELTFEKEDASKKYPFSVQLELFKPSPDKTSIYFDKAVYVAGTENPVLMTLSNLKGYSIKGIVGNKINSSHYVIKDNTITIKNNFLRNFEAGAYQFMISLKNDSTEKFAGVYFTVYVTDSKSTVYGVSLDFDFAFPKTTIRWSCDNHFSLYSVYMDGKKVGCTRDKQLVLDVFNKAQAHKIRIANIDSSSEIEYMEPDSEKQAFLNDSYTYMGVKQDLVMNSYEELYRYVEYGVHTLTVSHFEKGSTSYDLECYLVNYDNSDLSAKINKLREELGESYPFYIEYTKDLFVDGKTVFTLTYQDAVALFVSDYKKARDVVANNFLEEKPKNVRSFAVDAKTKTQSVYTSQQLMKALAEGVRPNPIANSPAAIVYGKMREMLTKYVTDEMTDFEKTRVFYDWLISNVSYDLDITYINSAITMINSIGEDVSEASKLKSAKTVVEQLLDLYNDKDNNLTTEIRKLLSLSTSREMISGLKYIYGNSNSFYLEGIFVDGVAVCDGFSKAFFCLCAIEGIDCLRIVGTYKDRSHAWNKVFIDGVWYVIDSSSGNTLVKDKNYELGSHAFFLLSEWQAVNLYLEKEVDVVAVSSSTTGLTSVTGATLEVQNESDLRALAANATVVSIGNSNIRCFELVFNGNIAELELLLSSISGKKTYYTILEGYYYFVIVGELV